MSVKTIKSIVLIFSNKEKQDHLKTMFPIDEFRIIVTNSGEEAIELVKKNTPSLIVMDVELDGMDGIETCQYLRNDLNLFQTVIVFLTERSEDYTQIAAYEAGADDYLPYSIRTRLLIRKLKTLLNRKDLCCPPENYSNQNTLIIDVSKFLILYKNKEFSLSKKEFQLLLVLAKGNRSVINRDEIMQLVWEGDKTIGDRTIDVHIRKIREKISSELIRTIKGVGYQLNVSTILK